MTEYHHQYQALLGAIMEQEPQLNARTGREVRVAPRGGASQLSILVDGKLPKPGNRRVYPHLAAAETAWQVLGTCDASFILERAPKLWGKFVDEVSQDGTPLVLSAYGLRMRETHLRGRCQLEYAVEELRRDPSSRRAYVDLWRADQDMLQQTKTVPCPVGFTVSSTPDGFSMHVFVRSSDVVVGLPYDVMNFALLGDLIAQEVGARLRWLTMSIAHAHIYEDQYDVATHSLEHFSAGRETWPELPSRWTLEAVDARPNNYVDHVRRLSRITGARHSYSPVVDVVE